MKSSQKKQSKQRRIVQQKVDRFSKLNEPKPPAGWIKAIRGSLGLSTRQLAHRVGVGHGAINQLERREPEGRVTLATMEHVARAMECKLVYAIVPMEHGDTLDTIIEKKAIEAAKKILKKVAHTMQLEAQGTSAKQLNHEIQRIARELKETSDSRIWDIEKKKKAVR